MLKDLGIDLTQQTEILEVFYNSFLLYEFIIFKVSEPPARQAGGFVEDVPTLVKKLQEKGVI